MNQALNIHPSVQVTSPARTIISTGNNGMNSDEPTTLSAFMLTAT